MKEFGKRTFVLPMPVFIISTFDEFNKPNAMNAAWGGTYDTNQVFLCLASDHYSTANIIKNKEFCIAFASKELVKSSDYVGIVSANNKQDKFEKSGLHFQKSKNINAPILIDYPISLECKVSNISFDESKQTCYVIADIINVLAKEEVLDEKGNIDINKAHLIVYDPTSNSYYEVKDKVADAFKIGLELK